MPSERRLKTLPAFEITVNELPESFVDQHIQDTAEHKQVLKQHLELDRVIEVSVGEECLVVTRVITKKPVDNQIGLMHLPATSLRHGYMCTRNTAQHC